jgi:hypothetical protein
VGSGKDCVMSIFIIFTPGIVVLRELDNWGVEKTA